MPTLNPYINLRGNAREALEFYHSVFGGKLTVNTFRDFQMPGIGADEADLVMHGQLQTEDGLTLMVSDTPASMPLREGGNITISLSGSEESTLRGYWSRLSEGASAALPLEVAPWGDAYGQLTDKFGIAWLINIAVSGDPAPA